MTEDEARKKWCPFSRTGAFTDQGRLMAVTVNRDPRDEIMEGCRCIASECMAWRWVMESVGGIYFSKYRRTPIKDSLGHFENVPEGYCGLAGEQPS